MAFEDKRMGVFTTVPSAYQRTEQFRVLDNALSSPPYHEILAPGSEGDLPNRAAKRRKILCLANDLLHGRPLLISSTIVGSQALQDNIESHLKEQDREWPQTREASSGSAAWKDIDDVWTVLYHAQLNRRAEEFAKVFPSSPLEARGAHTSRHGVGRTYDENIVQTRVVDETILAVYPDRGSPAAVHMNRTVKDEPLKQRQARLAPSSSTKKTAAVSHKSRRDISRPYQTVITTAYKRSKSSQMSIEDKDDEICHDKAAALDSKKALMEHNDDVPRVVKPVPSLQAASPFVFHKRKSRPMKVLAAATAKAEQQEDMAQKANCLSQGEIDMVGPAAVSPNRSTHPTPVITRTVKEHANSPVSTRITPSSTQRVLRQASRGFDSDIVQAEDLHCSSPDGTDVRNETTNKEYAASATRALAPTAWPGTQVLIEQAHEALFDSPVEHSIIDQRANDTHSSVTFDKQIRQAATAGAPETQEIMNSWSPWFASKIQPQRTSSRASILPPTVNPKHLFSQYAQSSPKKDTRSGLRFSLDLAPSNSDVNDLPRSKWTPVNCVEEHAKGLQDRRHRSRESDVTSTTFLDFQAAQMDSIARDRAEMDMDRDIMELAGQLLSSPST